MTESKRITEQAKEKTITWYGKHGQVETVSYPAKTEPETVPAAADRKQENSEMNDFKICMELEEITERLQGLFSLISAQFTEITGVGVPITLPSAAIFIQSAADDIISDLVIINNDIQKGCGHEQG